MDIDRISHLYNYLSPPPYGAGGHGLLTIETCSRSITYAKMNPSYTPPQMGIKGEDLHSQMQHGNPMVSKEIQGFWNVQASTLMIKDFCQRNRESIDLAINETIEWAHKTTIGEIGKGRQTLDVISGQCMKASAALERFCSFLNDNGMGSDFTLISFCDAYWSLFEKVEIVLKKPVYQKIPKRDKGRKTYHKGRDYTFKKVEKETRHVGRDKDTLLFDMLRTFETFRKDGERNKSVRRAIASPGIPLRVFLRIIEEFGKKLCNKLPESTISIGGDEKKDKIQQLLNVAITKSEVYPSRVIITGDNSKWNETQSPQLMKLIMDMFCSCENDWFETQRAKSGLFYHKQVLNKISDTLFAILFQKRVKTGLGFRVQNEKTKRFKYINVETLLKNEHFWNDEKELFDPILNNITDGEYITVSTGMIMGMLNIFSTVVGLIANSYNSRGEHDSMFRTAYLNGVFNSTQTRKDLQEPRELKMKEHLTYPRSTVLHLQSSDDFFTIVLGYDDECTLSKCSELYSNNKVMGINWSKEKTWIRQMVTKGTGEYTSWFVQGGRLIPQWGSDTAQLRPFGINCQSDMSAFIRNICQKLATRNMNYFGGTIALNSQKRHLRILYRIEKGDTPMKLDPGLVCFANGGTWKFTPSKCHLDETAIILYKYETLKEEASRGSQLYSEETLSSLDKYILRLLNPACPLNSSIQTISEFDPDIMDMVQKDYGVIMNCNNIQMRSNMKITNKKMEENERRQIYGMVEKCAVYIRPTLSAIGSNAKIPLKNMLEQQLETYQIRYQDDSATHKMIQETVKEIKSMLKEY